LIAAYHPGSELLGISTVHGNASIDHTTENAGSVLTAIGRPEIPVYKGANKPLVREAVHADAIHGMDSHHTVTAAREQWIRGRSLFFLRREEEFLRGSLLT
jgi:inosine-uridine nucleoside N-ribohydrolase